MVWSPDKSSKTDQLVKLAEMLTEDLESKKREDQLNAIVRTTHSKLFKKTRTS